MDTALRQRGRASLEFAAQVGRNILVEGRHVADGLRNMDLDKGQAKRDLNAWFDLVEDAAAAMPAFGTANRLREWYSVNHCQIAIEAFDEIADSAIPALDAQAQGLTTLDDNPALQLPAYWTDNIIHRTEAGWDGHPYMGFVHGALVHSKLVAAIMTSDIFASRRTFADLLADGPHDHILELGCGSGQFTTVLAKRFPATAITACDLSIRQLEQAQRELNGQGAAVALRRCSAADTGFDDGAFDLVTSYAILHELPADTTRDIFQECFRVLRPGGVLCFADVPPYSELDPLMAWQSDYAARHEGEPFWREAAQLLAVPMLREIGFVDVERYGMSAGPYPFPFVTRAIKP